MTKMKAFKWTDECQRAFEELEAYLASPPLLSQSKPDEELSLYLAVSPRLSVQLSFERRIMYNYLYATPAERLKEQKKDILPWRSWPSL